MYSFCPGTCALDPLDMLLNGKSVEEIRLKGDWMLLDQIARQSSNFLVIFIVYPIPPKGNSSE
jgi:hypothetical protein